MSLPLHNSFGSYRIIALLGSGGMGEVYRASDPRLDREVAIKLISKLFAADPARTARFEREAKMLAQLNHPNIASIYGLEDVDGTRGLVMELISGPTLAERLRQGVMSAEEILPLAKQIADALEYAHERNIVHRDLKPANIKLSPDNGVKVLDFGLAKALQDDLPQSDALTSPTISHIASQAGMILGTAAYMAPEQAKGKPVDRRADIWAFGCVLFEMLTGKRAFQGETTAEVLVAVIMQDPDWASIPAATPPRIRELLQRCLRREQKQRLQSIGDARITIEEVLAGTPDSSTPQRIPNFWHSTIPWALAAVFALIAVLLFYRARPGDELSHIAIHTSIMPPAGYGLSAFARTIVSPDGRSLVFVVSSNAGPTELWVRPLNSLVAKSLPGTGGAALPFWSSDSQWIGFFANNKLKKISINGGGPLDICDSSNGRGGAWGPDGTILFVPDLGAPVNSVSAAGGTPQPVTQLDKSLGELAHRWPIFLPDGKHFLFFSQGLENAIYAASLASPERKLILKNDSNVLYDRSGYLLFVNNHVLMAQPFNAQRLAFTGVAAPIADDVPVYGTLHLGLFSNSQNGVLAVQSQMWRTREAVWLDRAGNALGVVGEPALFESMRLSPDGEKVAFAVDDPGEGSPNLWVYDVHKHQKSRLTFGLSPAQNLAWSPDGKRIAFDSIDRGQPNLFTISVNGVARPELLLSSDHYDLPNSWSPDGRFVAFMRKVTATRSHWQLWILPLSGDRKPYLFLDSPFDQRNATFSPDGKWLAFESDESGRFEVYVVPFPEANEKVAVSTDGATKPVWSRDGRQLFFLSADRTVTGVSLHSAQAALHLDATDPFFKYPLNNFDVSPDGKTFLTFRDVKNQPVVPITLITNWTATLKK